VIIWTFCSGIGAPEAAMPHWHHALACEIEAFPRAVLMERLGFRDEQGADSRLYADMTTFDAAEAVLEGVPLPDVIVAGTPCQAFSIAGARKGLEDARGNLTMRLVEIYHDTIELARAAGRRPPVLLWENVPGALSDNTNAIGCFMGALVGGDAPLPRPADGSWPSAGMAAGPRARLAWRILDAQYFGLAQRRRRVFVVVDPGAGCDPAAVLFERQGLQRHPPSREEPGQVSPTIPARSLGGGGLGTDFDCDGGLIPSTGEVAHCLNAVGMRRQDFETETLVTCKTGDTAHALTGEGHDAREDGTGRGTPIIAFHNRQDPNPSGDITHTRGAQDNGMAVAFTQNSRDEVHLQGDGDICGAISAATGMNQTTYMATTYDVRRLTPRECERLQGFPDDWTAICWRGKPADQCPDGPRYKALGNSMAVPVLRWIMDRIEREMRGE